MMALFWLVIRLTWLSMSFPWLSGQLTQLWMSSFLHICWNIKKYSTSSIRLVELIICEQLCKDTCCRVNILEESYSGKQVLDIVFWGRTLNLDRRNCKSHYFKVKNICLWDNCVDIILLFQLCACFNLTTMMSWLLRTWRMLQILKMVKWDGHFRWMNWNRVLNKILQ